MKNPIHTPDQRNLIMHGRNTEQSANIPVGNPALKAEEIAALLPSDAWDALRQIPLPLRSEVFAHLNRENTATLIGAVLPLAAARLRVDPAVIASPALTTIVDISGLLIYFTTVKFILGI